MKNCNSKTSKERAEGLAKQQQTPKAKAVNPTKPVITSPRGRGGKKRGSK